MCVLSGLPLMAGKVASICKKWCSVSGTTLYTTVLSAAAASVVAIESTNSRILTVRAIPTCYPLVELEINKCQQRRHQTQRIVVVVQLDGRELIARTMQNGPGFLGDGVNRHGRNMRFAEHLGIR